MRVVNVHIIFVLLISFQFIYAAEPDDFKSYDVELPDSTSKVNTVVNSRLNQLKDALSEKKVCAEGSFDRGRAVSILDDYLNSNFSYVGNALAGWEGIERDIAVARTMKTFRPSPLHNSSYSGVPSFYCCYGIDSLNINGVVLGIDKIDHFFGNGGMLWLEIEANKDKVPVGEGNADLIAAEMSMKQENKDWGLEGPGQKSYGDLAANWKGYNFWKELIDGETPFFECKGNQVSLNRSFDISSYTDELWNEAINCSTFKTFEMASKIESNLKRDGKTCPMDLKKCESLKEKYKTLPKQIVERIISPNCLSPKDQPFPSLDPNGEKMTWNDWVQAAKGLKFKMVVKHVKAKVKGNVRDKLSNAKKKAKKLIYDINYNFDKVEEGLKRRGAQ